MMKKRVLSLLLALGLCLSLLPVTALADGGAAGTDMPGADTVARVGDAYYASLDTAIAAAGGGTVRLFLGTDNAEKKLELKSRVNVKNPVTLDLNEKTLDVCFGNNPGIYISGEAAKVTIQNGTVNCTEPNAYGAVYVSTGTSSTVDLEDVIISNQSGGPAIILMAANGVALTVGERSEVSNKSDKTKISTDQAAISNFGKATINVSGKVLHTGTFAAINGAWSEDNQYTTNINVKPGAVVSQTQTESDPQGAGILMMSQGTVTVEGGGKVSGSSGIDVTLGNVIIENGAEITGNGPYSDKYTSSGDGKVYEDGSAIFIDPAGATSVTIKGGTLTSAHGHAVSARDTDNKDKLTVSIAGGTLAGASGKDAVKVNDLTGIVSGGAFSSAVDSGLLSADLKYAAKKSSGDTPYSYHKTEAEAKTAAGTGGTVTDLASGNTSPGGGSSGGDGTTYKITVASTGGGTVTANKTYAAAGDTVTLTITPNSGYYLSSISTTPSLTLGGSGNTRTFTMPAGSVSVSATFSANSTAGPLTGYVTIVGGPWVGDTLTAIVRNTNNAGSLCYQWTADGYNIVGETSSTLYLTGYEVGKIIRCVVTSTVQTGSIVGRYWETVDYYNNRYEPAEKPSNNNNTGGTNQGGNAEEDNSFTIDSPIFATATNADGTKTTTVIEPDGSTGLVILTGYGTVSSASMTFSSAAYAAALRTGRALTLPTAVQPARSAAAAAPVRIILPLSSGSVKVKIPVSQMTAGTVAVMENSFGPDRVVKSSVSESNGVLFALRGSAVVKIVDNSKSFQDVFDGAWYTNAVKWASSREVMSGVSAQKFDPQGTVNRAMMAQMLYNFDGAEDTGAYWWFSDVSRDAWYAASVSWATRSGIARNYGDYFGAEDALTREDMALMLYNYARALGQNTSVGGTMSAFSDNIAVSDWARAAMQWAVSKGLITGTQNGTKAIVLDPQGTVNRAQLATIMQRFNNLL